MILRPCQQLKAPHRLHSHHGAAVEGRGRRRDRLGVGVRLAVPVQPWPALGATDGLGMEAAVGRVAVVAPAAAAGGKGGQAGVAAFKGELLQQAVAGAAVGAADERVAVAAVVGVGELGQAGSADGQIGPHHRRLGGLAGAGPDRHARGEIGAGRRPVQAMAIDAGPGRWVQQQLLHQVLQRSTGPLQLHRHAIGAIAHPAPQPQLLRQPHHMGAKAHPLHQPLQLQLDAWLRRPAQGHGAWG